MCPAASPCQRPSASACGGREETPRRIGAAPQRVGVKQAGRLSRRVEDETTRETKGSALFSPSDLKRGKSEMLTGNDLIGVILKGKSNVIIDLSRAKASS